MQLIPAHNAFVLWLAGMQNNNKQKNKIKQNWTFILCETILGVCCKQKTIPVSILSNIWMAYVSKSIVKTMMNTFMYFFYINDHFRWAIFLMVFMCECVTETSSSISLYGLWKWKYFIIHNHWYHQFPKYLCIFCLVT